MTEQEVTECVAIAQLTIEAVAQNVEGIFDYLGWDDYAENTAVFVGEYLKGILDIVRVTE